MGALNRNFLHQEDMSGRREEQGDGEGRRWAHQGKVVSFIKRSLNLLFSSATLEDRSNRNILRQRKTCKEAMEVASLEVC